MSTVHITLGALALLRGAIPSFTWNPSPKNEMQTLACGASGALDVIGIGTLVMLGAEWRTPPVCPTCPTCAVAYDAALEGKEWAVPIAPPTPRTA